MPSQGNSGLFDTQSCTVLALSNGETLLEREVVVIEKDSVSQSGILMVDSKPYFFLFFLDVGHFIG